MLHFKARRRRDPTESPFITPSQRRVMNMLRDAMLQVRDQVAEAEGVLLDAILHRPLDQIADLVPVDPWIDLQEPLADELLGDLNAGGHRYARQVPTVQKATVTFRFDDARPEGARWARRRAGELVTQITTGQRFTIRTVVEDALLRGGAPRDVARNLRNTIGLTTEQAGWVRNFQGRQVADLVAQGFTPQQALARSQTATTRYHNRIHRYRTEAIARTEILSASHEGRRQAWGQGLSQGFISPNAMQEWSAEVDNRVCQICESYDQMRVPIGSMFPDGDPPIHPFCRCDVLLIDDPGAPQALPDLPDAQLAGVIDDVAQESVGLLSAPPSVTSVIPSAFALPADEADVLEG